MQDSKGMKRLVVFVITLIGALSISVQCYADGYHGDGDSFNTNAKVASQSGLTLFVERK